MMSEYLAQELVQLLNCFSWGSLQKLYGRQQVLSDEKSRRQKLLSKVDPFSKEVLMIPVIEKYRTIASLFIHI